MSSEDLKAATLLEVGTDPAALREADFVIIAVPTPVHDAHQPDLQPIGQFLPCRWPEPQAGRHRRVRIRRFIRVPRKRPVPHSRATLRQEMEDRLLCRLLPERINPGDKERTVTKIVKVVSRRHAGNAGNRNRNLRERYHRRGIPASCIKVAEAAKVIENTQRDRNIALMNELAIIFDKIGIDTLEVFAGGRDQMGLLPFRPTVGGHCIGVEPSTI